MSGKAMREILERYAPSGATSDVPDADRSAAARDLTRHAIHENMRGENHLATAALAHAVLLLIEHTGATPATETDATQRQLPDTRGQAE